MDMIIIEWLHNAEEDGHYTVTNANALDLLLTTDSFSRHGYLLSTHHELEHAYMQTLACQKVHRHRMHAF